MANKIKYVTVPNATREMLAAKLDELKSSVDQLDEGHLLDQAYGIISSISMKPYQFHIAGPLQIFPDSTDPYRELIIGPVPVPAPPSTTPAAEPASGVEKRVSMATIECPNCSHKLKIKISC